MFADGTKFDHATDGEGASCRLQEDIIELDKQQNQTELNPEMAT